MTPPIDVLALAEARVKLAWGRLVGRLVRIQHTSDPDYKAWIAAQDDWCRALDLSRELQAADAN